MIHLPDEALPSAMDEIVRCSTRHVLCGEYFGDPPSQVRYRGLEGALFKRDYGRLYMERFPECARPPGAFSRSTMVAGTT